MHSREENCSTEKEDARQRRKLLSRAGKALGRAEKIGGRAGRVHIRGALYLWATVSSQQLHGYKVWFAVTLNAMISYLTWGR